MRNTWVGMCVSGLVHGGVALGVWGLTLVVQGDARSWVTLDLALLPALPEPVTAAAPPVPAPPPKPQPVVPPAKPPPAPLLEPPKPVARVVPQTPKPAPLPVTPPAPVAPPARPQAAVAAAPAAVPVAAPPATAAVPAAVAADPVASSAPAPTPVAAAAPGPAPTEAAVARAEPGVSAEDYAHITARLRSVISYPKRAREMGWEGVVVVAFRVKTDGAVENVRVVTGSGYRVLDESAVADIHRAAPFAPVRREEDVTFPVTYNLR